MPESPTHRRPARPLVRLRVAERRELSPAMVRVVFDAEGFDYAGHTDSYLKLLFADDGPLLGDLPDRPTTRTYTVRAFDPATNRVTVDFVVHGDDGLAGRWAARCTVGDELLARGPGGKWSPAPDAAFHLFVGDEASLPAIEAALERLDDDARGLAVVEFAAHAREVAAPAGVEVRALVRGGAPYREEWLAEQVAELDFETLGDVEAFIHGERGAVKALRAVVSPHVPRERLSISGYWAYGRIEDEFQAEKKAERAAQRN